MLLSLTIDRSIETLATFDDAIMIAHPSLLAKTFSMIRSLLNLDALGPAITQTFVVAIYFLLTQHTAWLPSLPCCNYCNRALKTISLHFIA